MIQVLYTYPYLPVLLQKVLGSILDTVFVWFCPALHPVYLDEVTAAPVPGATLAPSTVPAPGNTLAPATILATGAPEGKMALISLLPVKDGIYTDGELRALGGGIHLYAAPGSFFSCPPLP